MRSRSSAPPRPRAARAAVLAGRGPGSMRDLSRSRRHDIDDPSTFTDYCRSGPAASMRARLLRLPSLYEGFGCRCWAGRGAPVVAPRGLVRRGVGDAALLVDPACNRSRTRLAVRTTPAPFEQPASRACHARRRVRVEPVAPDSGGVRRRYGVEATLPLRSRGRARRSTTSHRTYIQGLLEALPGGPALALVGLFTPGRPPCPAAQGVRAPSLLLPVAAGPSSLPTWQLALAARRNRVDLYHAGHYVCRRGCRVRRS